MSTYTKPAVTGAYANVVTHPRIEVSDNPGTDTVSSGAAQLRRKADAMVGGLVKQAAGDQGEYARSVKKRKHSDEDVRKRLANLSLNAPVKKRVRSEGEAVKLRKRFLMSLRNLPAPPNPTDGAQYTFTFTPNPFATTIPAAMSDIGVSMLAIDLGADIVTQQVPMLLPSLQVVDPEGLGGAPGSISQITREMDDGDEPVLASPVTATSIKSVIDMGTSAAGMDKVPRVVTPVNTNTFIPRFLARAAAAKASRHAVQLRDSVRGVTKPTTRKVAVAGIPYSKTQRPSQYSRVPRKPVSAISDRSRIAEFPGLVTESLTPNNDPDKDGKAPQAEVQSVEGAAAESKSPSIECPVIFQAGSSEVIFGSVLRLPPRVSGHEAMAVKGEGYQIRGNIHDKEELLMEIVEENEVEVTSIEEEFVSFPPSPSPSSPHLPPRIPARHDCTDQGCVVCHLLKQMETESEECYSPPSLCTDSEDSSAYTSDVDEYLAGAVPAGLAADPSAWRYRESRVLPELDEDDAAVVVRDDEVLESGIIRTADLGLESLVAHLDKWSCKDTSPLFSSESHLESPSTSDSTIWYDAMDTDVLSPAVSRCDMDMFCESPSSDISDDLFASHIDFSAPTSPAQPATGLFAGWDFTRPSTPRPIPGAFDVDEDILMSPAVSLDDVQMACDESPSSDSDPYEYLFSGDRLTSASASPAHSVARLFADLDHRLPCTSRAMPGTFEADHDAVFLPAVSLGDIPMACRFDSRGDLPAGPAHYSMPSSPVLLATDLLINIESIPHGHIEGVAAGHNVFSPLASFQQPSEDSLLDVPQVPTDIFWDAPTGLVLTSSEPRTPGLDDALAFVLPRTESFSSLFSGDDSASEFGDEPSVDLTDLNAAQLPAPAPSTPRVLPGSWEESLEFLNNSF